MSKAMMKNVTTYSDIEDAEHKLNAQRHSYLRRWGWELTCNTPGSYWMWRRDFADHDNAQRAWWEKTKARVELEGRKAPSEPRPYGVITASTETAVSMTVRCLDEQPEINGDDEMNA